MNDTALALQALKAANYPDLSVSNTALAYLTNTQNPDGGWGFVQGDDSSIYMTAIVSYTLQQFPQTTTIANAISKASAYLTMWQNIDGGFGTSPSGTAASTVFETALAYAALVGDGQTQALPLQNALNYLTSTQSLNGSWNDDPYATALALKALYLSENKPAPPSSAATTGSVMGTVVDGTTNAPLAGVTAVLVGVPGFSATTNATGMFSLSGIPTGSQQITLTATGYAPLTITASISAGTFINVGKIGLSTNPISGTVLGVVWDADENAPYPGVTVQVQSGIYFYSTLAGADGSYRIANIPPGTVTVGTPTGPKGGYWNVPITGNLAPGGILIYSPRMSKTHPPFANLYMQTDKALYRKGDTVALTVNIQNNRSIGYPATLKLHVTDPSGVSVYDTSMVVNLTAHAMLTQNAGFTLPLSGQGGFYTAQAELYDGNGEKLGTMSANFGLIVSQIAVTPKLPAQFSQGANTVAFDLANKGSIAVSSGNLAITLKDPDGQVITSASQPFSLAQRESKTLTFALSFPALKFGTYTLSYTQSDETTNGQAVAISLPNSIDVSSLFDKSSYKIRETANLLLTLNNTGKFSFDAVTVNVAATDAGYADTKALAIIPGQTTPLRYAIPLPETMTAGQHTATVNLTLPGGSLMSRSATLTVPQSSLAFSLDQTAYTAGSVINPVIANNGGVDTQAQCRLSLYDAGSALIADQNMTGAVPASGAFTLSLPIPAGASDGSYTFVISYQDSKTGKSEIDQKSLTITGVNATLTVQTDKPTYLNSENISAQSNIINSSTQLQGGNLHLQVTAAGGSQAKKTWTSQYDFQQGIRNGVDTFEVPDSVRLAPFSDNFNDSLLNTDRWSPYNNNVASPFALNNFLGSPANLPITYNNNSASPQEQNGILRLYIPSNPAYNWISSGVTNKSHVDGDFDVNVDYNIVSPWNYPGNNHAANITVSNSNYWMYVDVWGYGPPIYGTIDSIGLLSNQGGAALQGKLRIQRVGTNYFSYYWNGTGWNRFLSYYNRPTGPIFITLSTYGQGGSVETYFDNFTVSTHTYPSSGTLNLKYDRGRTDVWDKLSFTSDIPSGTSIEFRTRTAADEASLSAATWSDYITSSGATIASPPGRWIEIEATLSTTDTNITPLLHDVSVTCGSNPGDIFWQTDVPVKMAQNAVSNLSNVIGTLGIADKYYLQGALTSSTGQTIATSDYPFYIVQGSMALAFNPDKKIYKPGDTVTLTGEVKNLATIDATNLTLALNGKSSDSTVQTISTETFTLSAGTSHPFTVTTTAGVEGTVSITGTVTQNGTILAEIADQYRVGVPQVTTTLTAPETAGNDPFTVSLGLTNSGLTDAVVTVGKSFDSTPQTVTVPARQTKLLQYSQQITVDTTYVFTLTGDLKQALTKTVVYSSTIPVSTVGAKIVTDKISYYANAQVAITSTVTNPSSGTSIDNLINWTTVIDSSGKAVYSASATIAQLGPGQANTTTRYWNTAAYPAGTYVVKCIVSNGTTILGTSQATFQILGSAQTTTGITGVITSSENPIIRSRDEVLTWSVRNTGNEPLAGLTLGVTVINPDTQSVMQMYNRTITLPQNGTMTDSIVVPTLTFVPGAYIAVLQAQPVGMTQPKTLASMTFTIASPPPPTLNLSTLPDGSFTNNATLNVAGTATSVIGTVKLSINGVDVTVGSDGGFSQAVMLVPGPNVITVTATDVVDGATTEKRTITLDQTAPALVISTPADNAKTGTALLTVGGSVDETSTVVAKLGGMVQPVVQTGNSFSSDLTLVPGYNTIEITATDLANNTSTQKRTVLYDNQTPSLAVTNPNQDIRTNLSSQTIRGTASDPLTSVSISITMDGQTFTPTVVNGAFEQAVTFTAEKTYAIVVTATNEVGTTATVQRNVIYDITPPALTINPVTSPTNQTAQTISGTMEAGATVTITCATATVGSVSYPAATSWSAQVSGLTAEINSIAVTAADASGNTTNVTTQIVYDTTPPTGTIAINNGVSLTNTTQAQLALSASDTNGVSQMRFSTDGANWTDAEAFTSTRAWLLISGDGPKQVYVQFKDNAGNWSTNPITASITLDSTPPTVSATPAGGIFKVAQNVALIASEPASIYYTTDGSTPTTGSTVYSQSISIPTSTTLKYFARDLAGNSSDVRTSTYTIDTTPPVLAVSTLSDGAYTNNSTLNIAGTATDNTGVQSVSVNDTAMPVNADGSFSYALVLQSGKNTITVTAADLAGNKASDVRTINLDQSAPALVISTPADNAKTGTALLTVSGSVDETSTVVAKLGGVVQPVVQTGNTFGSDLTLVPGTNTIEVTATDLANNTSTQKRTVLYDNQTPSLAITNPNQDIRTNLSSLTIRGTASDPLTSVSVSIVLDGQTYTPAVVNGAFEQAVTFTTEKNYSVVVTATNEVGTTATIQRNVIYDITAPALTINPVTTPTTQAAQTISGTRESGLPVMVVCATATLGAATYPTATTWSVSMSAMQMGDNIITVTSTDVAGNTATVSSKITVATSTASTFSYAVFGNKSVTLSGGSYLDSYVGSPTSHVTGQYRHGDVGTNSLQVCSIKLTGGAHVYGNASVGVGGNPATEVCLSGGASVSGTAAALTSTKDMTPVPDPGGVTGSGALNLAGSSTKTLTTGNYRYSSVSLSGAGKLILNGQITLHVDGNITLSGGSRLSITSGPVVIFANGTKIDISGGAIVNSTQDPTNLVVYGSSALQTVNLSGGTNLHGMIFAPAAAVKISGGQETYGSIIGNTVDLSGGASVHYTEANGVGTR